MTIDEAIKHCNEVAAGTLCEGTVNHKECGEEHKQLAEWLEELKRTREQPKANTISDCLNCTLPEWLEELKRAREELKENTTENLCTHTEQFICSKCGLHLEDFTQQICYEDEDEDEDETYSTYFDFFYCPRCGRKVEGMD